MLMSDVNKNYLLYIIHNFVRITVMFCICGEANSLGKLTLNKDGVIFPRLVAYVEWHMLYFWMTLMVSQ